MQYRSEWADAEFRKLYEEEIEQYRSKLISGPSAELVDLAAAVIERYRPVLVALAAHDAGASDEEIRGILGEANRE